MRLGERLTKLRNNKGLTQKELSRIFSMSRSTYAQYETNNRQPDYETLSRIADYYSVTTDYLLGRTDNPNQPQKQDPPNYDEMVLSAPTLPDALSLAAALEVEYNLPKEWLHKAWAKAIEKFGVPKPVKYSDPAAHNNGLPGTGIFNNKE